MSGMPLWMKLSLALCGIVFLMAISRAIATAPPISQSAAPAAPEDPSWGAAVLGAKALQQSMRNPKSFELASALIMGDGAACYEYRAQNGFGGMNVARAVLAPDGSITSSEMTNFARRWNKECANKSGRDETWEIGYAAGFHGLFDK